MTQESRVPWELFWECYPQERIAQTELSRLIDYEFKTPQLLFEALTHRSSLIDFGAWAKRKSGKALAVEFPWNERLEFLGDSILGFCISHMIWQKFKDASKYQEGVLSRIRANLVREKTLAALARQLGLGGCLVLGRGEGKSGGRDRDSLLADVFEALIGAIYLDGGIEKAKAHIEKVYADSSLWDEAEHDLVDYKSRLQEFLQETKQATPTYVICSEIGPAHQKWFEVAAVFANENLGVGYGDTKKKASQIAAKMAFEALRRQEKKKDL